MFLQKKIKKITFTFYIYSFSRRFYPKWLIIGEYNTWGILVTYNLRILRWKLAVPSLHLTILCLHPVILPRNKKKVDCDFLTDNTDFNLKLQYKILKNCEKNSQNCEIIKSQLLFFYPMAESASTWGGMFNVY